MPELESRKSELKIKHFIEYVRFTPFETESAQGRAQERYRLSALGAAANAVSAGLAFITLIVTVPLTLPYLGQERFGVWMTIASLAGMLTFLDLGVGNGLVSHIARKNASGNAEEFRSSVTRAMLLLSFIGVLVGVTLAALNSLYPLHSIFRLETASATDEARVCVWVFILIFSCGIPASGLYRVFNGLQKTWVVHVMRSAGSVLSIVLVILLSKIEASPQYLLIATYGVQTFFPLLLLRYFVSHNWFTLSPHANWTEAKTEYKHLLNVGGLFFILQIGTMLAWGSDAVIVSALVGVAAVSQFAIAQRLYQIVSIPTSILNAPLWAAYADANAKGDSQFIARTLKRAIFGTLFLSSFLSGLVYIFSGFLLENWIGEAVYLSPSLLLAFAVWKIMESTGGSFSMFLNGLHIIRPQVVAVLLLCLLALPLKFYTIPTYGVSATVWSTVIGYFFGVVIFYCIVFRRVILRAL